MKKAEKKIVEKRGRSASMTQKEAVDLIMGSYPRASSVTFNEKSGTLEELGDSIENDNILKAVIYEIDAEATRRDGTVSVSLASEVLKNLVSDISTLQTDFESQSADTD